MSKNKKKLKLVIPILVAIVACAIVGIVIFTQNIKQANTDILEAQEEVSQVKQEEIPEIETEENVQENFEEEEQVEEQEEQQQPQAQQQTETKNTQTTTKTQSKEIPYYIKINYEQNVVTIYSKDENGNYTKPVKAMVCSCGTATPTSGTYTISDKYKWGKLFGGVSGQYCTRIVKSILFHSVPYLTHGDNGSLEYWEYDKLGTTASAGCIRLTVADAKWIYTNCAKGTQVEFYADSNPGPLGKPTAQKISSEEAVRNWDPTDPEASNPWKTYTKKEEQTNETAPSDATNQEQEQKPENTITPSDTANQEQKPENTITPSDTANQEQKTENTITPSNTINQEQKPENAITPGNTINQEQKPENAITSGNTINQEQKPENAITPGNTINQEQKPENAITSGNTINQEQKPENAITPSDTISQEKKPENAITKETKTDNTII